MKTNPALLSILFILSLLFCSCTKDEPVSPKDKKTVYYSLSGKVARTNDTLDYFSGVIVSADNIIDTTDEQGRYVLDKVLSGKVKIIFSHPDYELKDSCLELTGNLQMKTLMKRIRADYFPNETGNYWKYEIHENISNRTYVATHTVLPSEKGQEDVVTKAGTFKNCFKIKCRVYGDKFDTITTTWFMPGIGIVKFHYRSRGYLAYFDDDWTLLEYKVL